jgi:hypothetical protein
MRKQKILAKSHGKLHDAVSRIDYLTGRFSIIFIPGLTRFLGISNICNVPVSSPAASN